MALTLEDTKTFLRVDGNEEDALIEGFMLAAGEYLKNAGVPESAQGNLYDVVAKMIIALFYEHRDTVDVAIPLVIQNLIAQLAITGLVTE